MKESIEARIGRFLAGEMEEGEKKAFQNELASDPQLNEAYLAYSTIWQIKPAAPEHNWEVESAWLEFEKRNQSPVIVSMPRRNVAYWAIAASIVLVLFATYYFVVSPTPKTYLYSDAEHALIELKDGSQIHLHEGSAITVYPFTRRGRHVELSGEAFFEVTPDQTRPFTITCGKTNTEVVGTSFDLRQAQDQVLLFVRTGKVIFSSVKDHTNALALKAGEAAYFKDDKLTLVPNPSPNTNSWHTHQLQFSSMPLGEAVQDVSDYFGQIITIENRELESCKISIPLPYKNPEIKAVLNAISRTVGASVQQDGDKFIIKGGSCS